MTDTSAPQTPMQTTSGDADNGQTVSPLAHDVADFGLVDEGVRRIEWAERASQPSSCEHPMRSGEIGVRQAVVLRRSVP